MKIEFHVPKVCVRFVCCPHHPQLFLETELPAHVPVLTLCSKESIAQVGRASEKISIIG